ncbi:MAG TPA: low affinity iron permease family protein [Alphaproteobacteria bacterium]|nr:low affinity iron permease family protein [Alphaproteobacteria bacterium]
MSVGRVFGDVANAVARAAGKPLTFALAVLVILVWIFSGPVFHYSDTWQLIINTSTTIVTFLMVFLIQNSQNRDNAALQVKLDELIRVSQVKNMFVGIEKLSDAELEEIRRMCEARAKSEDPEDNDALKEQADQALGSVRRRARKAAEDA